MLKVCDKLDLYVSPNLKKDEAARRVAQELLDSPIEILSNLNKQELQIIDEFVKDGAKTYVVRKMRKTQYKLQKLYLVATYCDEANQEWHMLMPDELRDVLARITDSISTCQRKVRKGRLQNSSAWWQRWSGLWESKKCQGSLMDVDVINK